MLCKLAHQYTLEKQATLEDMAQKWQTLEDERQSKQKEVPTQNRVAARNGAILGAGTLGMLAHRANRVLNMPAWKRAMGGTAIGAALGAIGGYGVSRAYHSEQAQKDPALMQQLALEGQMKPLFHLMNMQDHGSGEAALGSVHPKTEDFYDNPFRLNHYVGTDVPLGTKQLFVPNAFQAPMDDFKKLPKDNYYA